MPSLKRSEAGFTLIELLVVVMILGVVGSIVTTGLVQSMQNTRQTQARVQAMAELQRAAERVSRELRAACPIVGTLDDNAVTAAIQRDGEQLRHTYRFEGGDLLQDVQRREGGNWVTDVSGRSLVTDLSPPEDGTFEYRGSGDSEAPLARDVRTIRMTFVRALPEGVGPVEVQTLVSLRNGGSSCD
jgi:prepilin-type N-terminal cleavage/methylation domain-containing protein